MDTVIVVSSPPPKPGGSSPADASAESGAQWRSRYSDYCVALAVLNQAFAAGESIEIKSGEHVAVMGF